MEAWIGKISNRLGKRAFVAALLAGASLAGTAMGATTVTTSAAPATTSTMTPAQVQAELQALQAQVAALKAKEQKTSDSAQSAAQVRAIVQEVLSNSQKQSQYLDNQLQAGYDNGFYIETPDKAFSFKANGYIQVRYTFSQADHTVGSGPTTETSGLNFRRARLIFSGNLYKNWFYMISGDFAGNSAAAYTMLDYYLGYKFNSALSITAGSHLVPFTYDEIYSSGQEFPELPYTNRPFDEGRALGVDVLGDIIPKTLSYDVQLSDGANSGAGNAGAAVPTGDNSIGLYGRVQYAPAGDMGDFGAESDLKEHKNFVWMLGVAAGGTRQKGLYNITDLGLSSDPSPGFLGGDKPTGNIYEATVDWHAKYRGFAFNTAGFFRDTNVAANTITESGGVTTPVGPLPAGYPYSFQQYGYYFEGGYMIVPNQWEIVGKFEQLITGGMPNKMEVYGAGVNYYMYGDNAKIQGAVTYVPDEAAYSNGSTGTTINTQDVIFMLQLQVKF